jgi:glycosyltransferase involved in cell wall biosynthesis
MSGLTVVIPTYRREKVLIDTLRYLFDLTPPVSEIIVIDQTERHDAETESTLHTMAGSGQISWYRVSPPSITHAMNQGLLHAKHDIVLFLDDDIRPAPSLLAAHLGAHLGHPQSLVAGRVIQPWEEGVDQQESDVFHFASTRPALIGEFMGGNFSISRDLAVRLGGFDENFVRVAYRFEAEFARRYCGGEKRIVFEPQACIHHLKAGTGGTRAYGEHLTTWRSDHAVGAYYFSLRTRNLRDFAIRPRRAIATRYHLRHPWQIPVSLLAEIGGMCWAFALFLRGPRCLPRTVPSDVP